jgi:hypothetical protein
LIGCDDDTNTLTLPVHSTVTDREKYGHTVAFNKQAFLDGFLTARYYPPPGDTFFVMMDGWMDGWMEMDDG